MSPAANYVHVAKHFNSVFQSHRIVLFCIIEYRTFTVISHPPSSQPVSENVDRSAHLVWEVKSCIGAGSEDDAFIVADILTPYACVLYVRMLFVCILEIRHARKIVATKLYLVGLLVITCIAVWCDSRSSLSKIFLQFNKFKTVLSRQKFRKDDPAS